MTTTKFHSTKDRILSSAVSPENRKIPKGPFMPVRHLGKFGGFLLWILSCTEDKAYGLRMISIFKDIAKNNGTVFLVNYLKESHRLTMKAISGQPERSIDPFRIATRRGLPLIIPGHFRLAIERKEVVTIQLVLSLLTVYRVLKIPPILKLNTITDRFSGNTKVLPEFEIRGYLREISAFTKFVILSNAKLLISTSAGPNNRIAVLGVPLDAKAWSEHPNLLKDLGVLARSTGPEVYKLLLQEIENLPQLEDSMSSWWVKGQFSLILGKLSKKLEAAGKVRLFAITDAWTQSVLRPLHDALLRLLSTLPTDGTYDQLKCVRRLYERGHSKFWSFDLTAATDRLPLDLQKQILSCLTTNEFAECWGNVLVKRPWFLKGVPYFYEVGQPMGAYSSWAMLALTHHTIVNIAARRVGKKNFTEYALLGDDLVIADEAVAQVYLTIASDLGVEINLSKSLISESGVSEFAKRLFWEGNDLSPLPPKLLFSLSRGLRNLPNIITDMVGRGIQPQIAKMAEERHLPIPILWELVGPLGIIEGGGLSPFLENKSLSADDYLRIITSVVRVINKQCITAFYRNQNKSQELIDKIGTLIWDGLNRCDLPVTTPGDDDVFLHEMSPEDAGQVQSSWEYHMRLRHAPKIRYVKYSYTLNTPAMQWVMNDLIETSIVKNTSPPVMLELPKDVEYNHEFTYKFIRDCVLHLESVETAVPDITQREMPSTHPSSYKMKFYKALEAELQKDPIWLASSAWRNQGVAIPE